MVFSHGGSRRGCIKLERTRVILGVKVEKDCKARLYIDGGRRRGKKKLILEKGE